MWKGCAFANAARNGVFAATLAADGHDRPGPDLRGRPRLLRSWSPASRSTPAPFGGESGNADGFMINKTYIKFWPAEYHSQSAIDAALQLRSELNGDVSKVDGDRHRHVRGELQHHRQVPGGVGAEDPRDGRPQPAVLHRRRPARRRRDLAAVRSRALHRARCAWAFTKVKVHLDDCARPALPARHPEPHHGDAERRPQAGRRKSSSRAVTPATR